jgi:2-amino-4-hydroxy-6-hydroxymethyldihydropteridine diphosphokinase
MVLKRDTVVAYIGLGANLGDAQQALLDALQALRHIPGIEQVVSSDCYRTAPFEATGPDYINAVAQVHTQLNAMDLLAALQAIEQAAGRERPYRNAPRTLDLDVLLYGSGQVNSPMLTVPHPRMGERAFVLVPLAELAPHLVSAEVLRGVADQPITMVSAPEGFV